MRMQRNFYEVLGLTRTATKKEIKEKYYTLARQFHPDRAKDKQLADRLFVQINRAYSTLFNDIKRAKYDASLDAIDQAPARPSSRQAGADHQRHRNRYGTGLTKRHDCRLAATTSKP